MEQRSLRTNDCTEKVIKQYSDMVYRLAFARTGTKHDADDVFQEVFFRYVKKRPVFRDEEHRKAWLIRVTINCSNSFWSSLWNKNTHELCDEIVFETRESIDLHTELNRLPPKYREVVHLFYYENMPLKKISAILHRKNSTVRTQLTRARAMLKKFMKEEDYV
ncbi:RNA polymerase sigma factor [Neobittarella massiliensis]|uniref:RNA polymerase sigma factor n=1 Tax=Neobittarella massiliensis (ex Bilen et al. 2018) TaxID=2041842 RepID=UPI000CF74540|nr:sigma-70 family RNA polymerase sigma factor [Neobittarella massiliensis]